MAETDLYKEILGIAIVFALLGAAVWMMGRRRRGAPLFWGKLQRSGGRMRVIERLHLTPQHSLVLLQLGRRALLVSIYPGGCALLETGPLAQFDSEEPGK